MGKVILRVAVIFKREIIKVAALAKRAETRVFKLSFRDLTLKASANTIVGISGIGAFRALVMHVRILLLIAKLRKHLDATCTKLLGLSPYFGYFCLLIGGTSRKKQTNADARKALGYRRIFGRACAKRIVERLCLALGKLTLFVILLKDV